MDIEGMEGHSTARRLHHRQPLLVKETTIRLNNHDVRAIVPTGAISKKEAIERFLHIAKKIIQESKRRSKRL